MDNPIVIVTGGNGGIGRAVVHRLRNDGFRVASVDVVDDADVSSEDDSGILRLSCDVSSFDDSARAFGEISAWGGDIGGLVTCAGTTERQPAYEMTPETWNLPIDVHLTGTFVWCQLAGCEMRKGNGGAIVTIGSICGSRGFANMLSYGVAKAGIHQLTRGLATEWAPDDIRVNAIAPGYIDTARMKSVTTLAASESRRLHAMNRLGTPEEIADAASYLLSSQSSFVTGQVLHVDGGFSVMARPWDY